MDSNLYGSGIVQALSHGAVHCVGERAHAIKLPYKLLSLFAHWFAMPPSCTVSAVMLGTTPVSIEEEQVCFAQAFLDMVLTCC